MSRNGPSPNGSVRRWKACPAYKPSGVPWLGDVPDHWTLKPLGRVVSIFGGMTPSKENAGFWSGPIPWVSPKDMKRPELDDSEDHISEEAVRSTGIRLVGPNAVLVVVRGMILARDFPVAVNRVPVTINQDMKALVPNEGLDADFLAYQLRAIRDAFFAILEESGHGTKCLRTELWRMIPCALPPLDEQRRIVAFLNRETAKVDALIAKKERLTELLQEKRQALIRHTVVRGLAPAESLMDSGVPWVGKIPEHWQVRQLGSFSRIGNGSTPLRDNPVYWQKGNVPWLNSSVVNDAVVGDPPNFVTTVALAECHLPVLKPGTVLVAITGEGKTRGKAAVLNYEATINQHIAYIRPKPDAANPAFLRFSLEAQYEVLRLLSNGGGSTKGALTCEQLRRFKVALPAVAEQEAIADFLNREGGKIDVLIARVGECIDRLREYRTALASAAVTGRIDVSDGALVEQEVVTEKPAAKPPNPYFRRTVFAAEIIDRLCDEPTFGHVKCQKCLFVAQHHLRLGDFEESYKRMAAGPYDNRLIRSVDSQLEKSQWFKAEKVGDRYAYRRLAKSGGHRQYFERYFGDQAADLARLLDLFRPLDTDRAEIVATLYAVWNDFLLRCEPVDDDRIVTEVLTNWHDRKKRFEEDRWRRALTWMREKNLVPTGFGKPTVPGDGGER